MIVIIFVINVLHGISVRPVSDSDELTQKYAENSQITWFHFCVWKCIDINVQWMFKNRFQVRFPPTSCPNDLAYCQFWSINNNVWLLHSSVFQIEIVDHCLSLLSIWKKHKMLRPTRWISEPKQITHAQTEWRNAAVKNYTKRKSNNFLVENNQGAWSKHIANYFYESHPS